MTLKDPLILLPENKNITEHENVRATPFSNSDLDCKFLSYLIVFISIEESQSPGYTENRSCVKFFNKALSQFNKFYKRQKLYENPVYEIPGEKNRYSIEFSVYKERVKSIITIFNLEVFDKCIYVPYRYKFSTIDYGYALEKHLSYCLDNFNTGYNQTEMFCIYYIMFQMWVENTPPVLGLRKAWKA